MLTAPKKAIAYSLTLVALWLGIFYPELLGMEKIWSISDTFAHGYTIFPISLWLLWRRRFMLAEVDFKPAALLLIPVLGFTLLWLAARVAGIQVIAQIAAISCLITALWALLGHGFIKVVWFPLLYLYFAVPLGEELIPHLQIITADITVFLLQLTGIPVFREGLYLSIPSGLFEVAVACSGIRYLIASIALGTLYAHLQFYSLKRQLAFVVFAAIVPIFANGVRAYLIVLLAHLSDMKLATGVDHLIYGWLFFGLVMFILFWLGSYWRQKKADPLERVRQTGQWLSTAKTNAVGALILISLLLTQIYLYKVESREPASLALNKAKWGAFQQSRLSSWQPEFKNADDYFQGHGEFEGQQVQLYVALYNDDRQDKELINSTHFLYNQGAWSAEGHLLTEQHGVYQLTSARGEKLELIYWYQLTDLKSAQMGQVKLTQAWKTLTSQRNAGAVVIMATPKSERSQAALEQAAAYLEQQASLWQVKGAEQ